ncbi:hypothetical protein [Burkholderia cepacia]|uniref:hypothetical protein n=1 Tax=Burkholderia cepacia TaxID=292 RepID=UPI00384FC8EC
MQFGRCPFEQADVADRLIGDVQALADGGKRHAMNVAQLCDGSGQIKRRRLLAVVAEIAVDHHFSTVERPDLSDVLTAIEHKQRIASNKALLDTAFPARKAKPGLDPASAWPFPTGAAN